MGRSVTAEAATEKYLDGLRKLYKFAFGLIIGQPTLQGKDNVAYLARTATELPSADGAASTEMIDSIDKIDQYLISNQATQVQRMLPGGVYVMGIFVVAPSNVFDNPADVNKLREILKELKTISMESPLLCSDSSHLDNNELLLLCYTDAKVAICKSFEVSETSRSSSGKPVDWKFQEKPSNWQLIETQYELDELFPLIQNESKVNIEKNLTASLDNICNQIENSQIFIEDEPTNSSDTFEALIKRKQKSKTDTTTIQATIFVPSPQHPADAQVMPDDGVCRFYGTMMSRVWANDRNTIEQAKHFIRQDLKRTLASRITMYIDSIVETDGALDSGSFLNEPPRRIFVDVKGYPLQFCDYVFRGEQAFMVLQQMKETLDVNENIATVDDKAEVNVEDKDETKNEKKLLSDSQLVQQNNRKLLLYGIVAAFLVLIASILLHFARKEGNN